MVLWEALSLGGWRLMVWGLGFGVGGWAAGLRVSLAWVWG